MAETKKTAEQLYAQAQEAQKQLEQLQAQQPGAYESSYGAQIDALMAQLDSRPGFTYDVNGDPLYRQYAEQYQRQGKAAMEDTLGAAAGLTGGYGSSYATTAASQAYQQYLSGMQDVAPALYAAAYARYQDEGTALEKQLERLQGLESNAYRRMAGPGAGQPGGPGPGPGLLAIPQRRGLSGPAGRAGPGQLAAGIQCQVSAGDRCGERRGRKPQVQHHQRHRFRRAGQD